MFFCREAQALGNAGEHIAVLDFSIRKHRADLLQAIREGLQALIHFSRGKVEPHFLEENTKSFSGEEEEISQVASQIHNIYSHLPHHYRNELSSLIHHKQSSKNR